MTLRFPIVGLASSLLLVAACGGSSSEEPPPEMASSEAAAAKPPPVTEKAPDTSAAAKPPADAKSAPPSDDKAAKPAASAHDADGPDGVRRWASWDGPKEGAAITTKKAWVFAPNLSGSASDKDSFGAIALTLVDVVKSDSNEVVFENRKSKYAVPVSLARAAEAPKGLKKGSIALCSFGGSSVVARIEAVDAKSVTCAFRFMDKTRKEKLAPEEVLPLDGKLGIRAPVLARFDSDPDTWYDGFVVAASGEDVWVNVETQFGADNDPRKGRMVHKLKAANVKLIDMTKPLKVGDACLADHIARIQPCKVAKVVDGGLAYVVSFEGSPARNDKEWTLDQVTPAPKDDAKKPAK